MVVRSVNPLAYISKTGKNARKAGHVPGGVVLDQLTATQR